MKADKAVLLEFRDGASTLSAMKFERFELPT